MVLAALPASTEPIARVIDGNTVVTAGGETVRLMHLDAPERRGKRPREGELARRATALLQRLADVGLDLELHGRDRYGQALTVQARCAGISEAGH